MAWFLASIFMSKKSKTYDFQIISTPSMTKIISELRTLKRRLNRTTLPRLRLVNNKAQNLNSLLNQSWSQPKKNSRWWHRRQFKIRELECSFKLKIIKPSHPRLQLYTNFSFIYNSVAKCKVRINLSLLQLWNHRMK